MVKIIGIVAGSIAEKLGIKSGDQLLQINQAAINDYIDYRYYNAGESLEVIIKHGAETLVFEIEKPYDEDIGIEPEAMKMMCCGNNCIFCFVYQNPDGMRRALYIKDEDYRFSFLYGHYVTLTRVNEAELQRIVKQHLSPLYVSVHATDWPVRKLLLGLKKDDGLLKKIAYLTTSGIELHTQIVLCPGINDGVILDKTIEDLSSFYPGIGSVAIVPVGLTQHRDGLYPLRILTQDEMRYLVTYIEHLQQVYRGKLGTGFVYLADEFYIRSDISLPEAAYYDDFYQMENGVGEFRNLIDRFNQAWPHMPKIVRKAAAITWVTGSLAYKPLQTFIIDKLSEIENLTIQLCPVNNIFYGRSITVSGLLVGKDIYDQMKDRELGDLVLLPPRITNADDQMLDNWTPALLQDRLGVPVHVFREPISEIVALINRILTKV